MIVSCLVTGDVLSDDSLVLSLSCLAIVLPCLVFSRLVFRRHKTGQDYQKTMCDKASRLLLVTLFLVSKYITQVVEDKYKWSSGLARSLERERREERTKRG
jgi:hypothetical protein